MKVTRQDIIFYLNMYFGGLCFSIYFLYTSFYERLLQTALILLGILVLSTIVMYLISRRVSSIALDIKKWQKYTLRLLSIIFVVIMISYFILEPIVNYYELSLYLYVFASFIGISLIGFTLNIYLLINGKEIAEASSIREEY